METASKVFLIVGIAAVIVGLVFFLWTARNFPASPKEKRTAYKGIMCSTVGTALVVAGCLTAEKVHHGAVIISLLFFSGFFIMSLYIRNYLRKSEHASDSP